MINIETAKQLADEIETASEALNGKIAAAAEVGVDVVLEISEVLNVDHAYHGIFLKTASVDLKWLSPKELEDFQEL